ncbi:MAG: glycosyltransferase [Alphaproteobacteria bacterium]
MPRKKKILIITNGTRGDIDPFIALSRGLIKHGYRPTICAPISFKKFITEHGIGYAYMNDGLPQIVKSELGRNIMESSASVGRYVRSGLKSKSVLRPSYRQQLDETLRAASQIKPDLVIFNHVAIYAHHVVRELNLPAMVAISSPILIPTGDIAHPLFPQWKIKSTHRKGLYYKIQRWYNYLTYRIFLLIVEWVSIFFVREWQDANQLKRHSNKIEFYHSAAWLNQPLPILHHYSPALSPRVSDWQNNIIITGYWFYKGDKISAKKNWQPPTSLMNFIARGKPPLYIGFGSMTASHETMQRLVKTIEQMLEETSYRLVIGMGWSKHDWQKLLANQNIADKIYCIDEVPHDWLFPRMAGVIHHGGAGTTAAAFRAMKPSIICPFFADQHFWARCIAHTNSGVGPLPLKKITKSNLKTAIEKITTDRVVINHAKKIGEKINKEDGVDFTINIIKKFMARQI